MITDWLKDQLRTSFWPYQVTRLISPDLRRRLLTSQTAVVVEGYPRSGNTYLQVSLEMLNPNLRCRIAHHLHSPAHVNAAVKRGIPAVVVVRDPLDAVASILVRRPDITAMQAIARFKQFHQHLPTASSGVVYVSFNAVTTQMHDVFLVIQKKFDLGIQVTEPTEEERRQITERITWENKIFGHGKPEALSLPASSTTTQKDDHKNYIETNFANEIAQARATLQPLPLSL